MRCHSHRDSHRDSLRVSERRAPQTRSGDECRHLRYGPARQAPPPPSHLVANCNHPSAMRRDDNNFSNAPRGITLRSTTTENGAFMPSSVQDAQEHIHSSSIGDEHCADCMTWDLLARRRGCRLVEHTGWRIHRPHVFSIDTMTRSMHARSPRVGTASGYISRSPADFASSGCAHS